MNLASVVGYVDRLPLPDAVLRAGVAAFVASTDRRLRAAAESAEADFALAMANFPVAEHTGDANRQHYEVPAAFFEHVLGPQRKYSSCFYPSAASSLGEAEEAALRLTCEHAGLRDGQSVLELGCGWGSLTLWMAQHYPGSRITAVSNSHSQRTTIEALAALQGLTNVDVITADMNAFAPQGRYDRIVSVEMFEHMANWSDLLRRVRTWLAENGRLFVHVFAHERTPYRFDHRDEADWIAQHFFTGGMMPSHGLMRRFPDVFAVEAEWRWSGQHYGWTARDWLANFDARIGLIRPILLSTYGRDAGIWERRWRLFFLATQGLFAHAGGKSWGVSHYLLRPVA